MFGLVLRCSPLGWCFERDCDATSNFIFSSFAFSKTFTSAAPYYFFRPTTRGGAPHAARWGSCPTYRRSRSPSTPLSSSPPANEGAAASSVRCAEKTIAQPSASNEGNTLQQFGLQPFRKGRRAQSPQVEVPPTGRGQPYTQRRSTSTSTSTTCPALASARGCQPPPLGAPRRVAGRLLAVSARPPRAAAACSLLAAGSPLASPQLPRAARRRCPRGAHR